MSKLLTFVLVGVAIGVLVAPDKGSATIEKLSDFFNDLFDGARDQVKDFAGAVKDTASSVQSAV